MALFRRLFVFLALSAQLPALSLAATPVALPELAPGLRYLRIHSLETSAIELAEALNADKSPALVIDLRYVAGEKGATLKIGSLINNQAPKPMLYILVSPETPAGVTLILGASTRSITLGIRN